MVLNTQNLTAADARWLANECKEKRIEEEWDRVMNTISNQANEGFYGLDYPIKIKHTQNVRKLKELGYEVKLEEKEGVFSGDMYRIWWFNEQNRADIQMSINEKE